MKDIHFMIGTPPLGVYSCTCELDYDHAAWTETTLGQQPEPRDLGDWQ